MKRTTVLLPDGLAALLDLERRRRDVSAAAIIRDALIAYLVSSPQPRTFSFIGIGKSGAAESIAEHMEDLRAAEARSEEGYNRMMFGTATRPDSPTGRTSQAEVPPPIVDDQNLPAK